MPDIYINENKLRSSHKTDRDHDLDLNISAIDLLICYYNSFATIF